MVGFRPLTLSGLLLVEPTVHRDPRGTFHESYRRDRYAEAGITVSFVQDNFSTSVARTIRGLHFQTNPGQAKLVRVTRGRIFDVVVDIRPDSPTFGRFEAVELDEADARQLFVPAGFAHGFAVLSDQADVAYRVSSYYDPATERSIRWNDPELAIPWPVVEPVISTRDANAPLWSTVRSTLADEGAPRRETR